MLRTWLNPNHRHRTRIPTVQQSNRQWHAPYLCFFSREFYLAVARQWQGSGLGYLFLLLAVVTIPLTFQVAGVLDQVRNVYMQHVIDELPPMSIEQGILSADVEQPYVIRLPEMDEPFLVIDTRDRPAGADEFQAPVVLLADRMIVDNQGKVDSIPFEKIPHLTLDKAQLQSAADTLMRYVKPLAYVPLLLSEFVYRALQAVIYAVGGLVFAAWLKVSLPYGTLLRLSCVALTPSILVGLLFSVLGLQFSGLGVLLFVLTQGYLFFAVQSVALLQDKPTADDILEV